MKKIFLRTLKIWAMLLIVCFGGSIILGGIEAFGLAFIFAPLMIFSIVILWFLLECLIWFYSKISNHYAPLIRSKKNFLILVDEKHNIITYYQKKRECFRIVSEVENHSLKIQNIKFFDAKKQTWENTSFHPILQYTLSLTQVIYRYYPRITSPSVLNFSSSSFIPNQFKKVLLENIDNYSFFEKIQKPILKKERIKLTFITLAFIACGGYMFYLILFCDLLEQFLW